jgi:hypothetical protein
MPSILSLVLRVLAVIAGLVFAASLAVVAVLALSFWGLRAAWARLTGRPVAPFAVRINPLGAWSRGMRSAGAASRTPRADVVGGRLRTADVTDVTPK